MMEYEITAKVKPPCLWDGVAHMMRYDRLALAEALARPREELERAVRAVGRLRQKADRDYDIEARIQRS